MGTRFFQALACGFSVVTTSLLLAVGCSSSSSPTPKAAPVAQCPVSIDLANGAACARAGEDCGIDYECGVVPQQAHCVCNAGAYACTDATGAAIAKGAAPVCVPNGDANDKECPTAEDGTEGKACKTAGLLCSYIGVQCPENATPNLDTCQCDSAANTAGLFFHCIPQLCDPSSDASTPIPPPVDSGTGKDAATDG